MRQNNTGQFGQCKRCGARIVWVKTLAGKNMPVDPELVDFKKIKGGKERLVLQSGEVVAGERCRASEADGYGYISHFATYGTPKTKPYQGLEQSWKIWLEVSEEMKEKASFFPGASRWNF